MEFSQERSDCSLDVGDDETEEDQIFSCRIENSKIMTDILNAIHAGGKDHLCEVKASARALVFSVIGRGKSTQARATLPAEIFEEYIFESSSGGSGAGHSNTFSTANGSGSGDGVMHFSINLTTLLDCLLLFGSTSESTAATLTFSVSVLHRHAASLFPLQCCCKSYQRFCLPCLSFVCARHLEPGRNLQDIHGGVWCAYDLQHRDSGEGRCVCRERHSRGAVG